MKQMEPVRFNPSEDLAPIPFDSRHMKLARTLKALGLPWAPHVGCFVWDAQETIKVGSPFPERVYFILSLPRFIRIFGSIEAMIERLVWLPTWHQARLLCRRLGVGDKEIAALWTSGLPSEPGDELLLIYERLAEALRHLHA